MRDKYRLEKMRVIKVIHAMIHKRIFIFYEKPQIFTNLSKMIVSVFKFNVNSQWDDDNSSSSVANGEGVLQKCLLKRLLEQCSLCLKHQKQVSVHMFLFD